MKLLMCLSVCCWTGLATRSYWNDKPSVIADDEMNDGETLKISCTLPIDYRGGECRLYRGQSRRPFTVMIATDFICTFYLTSAELLGNKPVGSVVRLYCDYKLQGYTSPPSDHRPVVVWGSRPSPTLSVSRRLLSPDDSVEVTCSPGPDQVASSCSFLRDQFNVARGACSRNLTGRQLAVWEQPALLRPVNMSCTYKPSSHLNIQSEPSRRHLLFVVDASRVSSSVACKVSVNGDQLEAFQDGGWTSYGANGNNATVTVTTGNLTLSETCEYMANQNRPE